ncbi:MULTISPECIES: ComF family protein [Methylococcus]|uniref:ComF family protein n=1 Tax=Methylococcus capsulatus TaxID=414 RepID=A0ABZ2F2L5_METCP|nr:MULTISPECIES: ComF family protein [Methylococcus]MDF9392811.1 ComF family protein [Methylococcus capsulatus]QXP90500.1 ComF family protein [Methylococcus capsulatus]UQN13178.1 ComF family protein [Methylococcus capsulatus]
MKTVNGWLNIIQNWIYPPTCLLCGASGERGLDLCGACERDLPRTGTACLRCGETLPDGAPSPCGRCLQQPPPFDSCRAAFRYEEPIRHLIHGLKFGRRHACARTLGELAAAHFRTHAELPELIVPVPLHPSRYRERGFNQSLEIARHVSRNLNIPLELHVCTRSRNTRQQSALSAKDRAKNIRGAFKLEHRIGTRHIAIFDDVVTTGATVGELSRTLQQDGVKQVSIWTIARA